VIDLTRLAAAVRHVERAAEDQIGRGYWSFSRQARGTLAPREAYERRATARQVLVTLAEVVAERRTS
jgi:hypothetical protein